jgi:DNA-binding transcriptional MocR family regulator
LRNLLILFYIAIVAKSDVADHRARPEERARSLRMRKAKPNVWRPELRGGSRQLYLQLVDAIASDIQSGRLTVAERLPAQRELAARLKMNYATISRAYREAQRRGLIYSRVGHGSFVCRPRVAPLAGRRGASLVDMTMNMPPEPSDQQLWQRLESGWCELAPRLGELLRYEDFGGSQPARDAGVRWLARVGVDAQADRLLVCPGAQSALGACFSLLAKPGDVALCEEITYPGARALAAQLGVRLIGLPADAEGISSEALARACAEHHPKLLYSNPTLQNPTTQTISAARRRELVAVARKYAVMIVEDDAYGVLPSSVQQPLAALAPEQTYYVSGFAKCLGPGLRVAYLLAPDARRAGSLSASLRASTIMASPITVALATECVENGTAEAALLAIRAESVLRQRIAREQLGAGVYRSHPEAFHLWLELPAPWSSAEFAGQLLAHGIRAVPSDAFSAGPNPPAALRVCLGGSATHDELRAALSRIAQLRTSAPS